MSNDSQESPSSRPRIYPSQMQIERLKREDEEEHWISGEELYTEGSSDDEEGDHLQRLTIRDPEVHSNAENIRSNLIVGSSGAIGRSKFSHSGKIHTKRGDNSHLLVHQKGKIDDLQPATVESSILSHSVISTPPLAAVATNEEKLSSPYFSSSYFSEDAEIADVAATSSICKGIRSDREENIIPEDDDRGDEISWRPKRDDDDDCIRNINFEEPIVQLREMQFEYHEILDSLSQLKTSLSYDDSRTNFTNSVNNESRNTSNNYYNNELIIIGEENCSSSSSSESIIEKETMAMQLIRQLQNGEESPFTATERGHNIIKDVSFSDRDVDRWSYAVINAAKIEKEIFKILKMDTRIEQLDQKVKEEIEETLKEQISNREELKRLQKLRGYPESGKLAKNSQLFFKLCSMDGESEEQDLASVYTVLPIYQSENELELKGLEGLEFENAEEEEEDEEEKSRKSRREKLEEELTNIDKRRASFIERNKKLASCAMGNLPITDEEKRRLEELINDINDEEITESKSDRISFIADISCISDNSSTSAAASSTPYTIDKEADELLKKLTEELENINSETYRKYSVEENRLSIAKDELIPQREEIVVKSLRDLAESGSKIIHPISKEEMRQLIDEYYAEEEAITSRTISLNNSLNDEKSEKNIEAEPTEPSTAISITSQSPTITKDLIDQLVKEARAAMPLFQFKHRTESLDDLQDNDEKNDP